MPTWAMSCSWHISCRLSSRPELLIPEGDEKRSGGTRCFVHEQQRIRNSPSPRAAWHVSGAPPPRCQLKTPPPRKEREKGRAPVCVCGESMGQPPAHPKRSEAVGSKDVASESLRLFSFSQLYSRKSGVWGILLYEFRHEPTNMLFLII
jgi:hypothetical protein